MTSGHLTETAGCIARVTEEYRESPGLNLTRAQLRRFLAIDDVECDAVIETLIRDGVLERTPSGLYVTRGRQR